MKRRITIMSQSPDIPDEEIRALMDFDALLKQRDAMQKHNRYRRLTWGIVSVVLLLSATLYFAPLLKHENGISQSSVPIVQHETSIVVDSDSVSSSIRNPELQKDEAVKKDTSAGENSRAVVKPHSDSQRGPLLHRNEKEAPTESTSSSVVDIYVQAEPVEGYDALYKYFTENLRYPPEAVKDSVQGVVTVSFIIDENGKPLDIEFRETVGAPFEEEARRLILNMPLWKAATLNGKPVRSKIALPITFSLNR